MRFDLDVIRLPELDSGAEDARRFGWGLVLTSGLDDDDLAQLAAALGPMASEQERADSLWLLRPWDWRLDTAKLARWNGASVDFVDLTAIPPTGFSDETVKDATAALDESFIEVGDLKAPSVAGLDRLRHGDTHVQVDSNTLRWPHRLAALSQKAAPIPHAIVRTTHLFTCAKADIVGWGKSRVGMVFTIDKNGEKTRVLGPQDDSLAWVVDLQNTAGSLSKATAICDAEDFDPDATEDLWLPQENVLRLSPRVAGTFPNYCAQLFDLSQRVLDVLHEGVAEKLTELPEELLDLWLASTWDSLHPAMRRQRDGADTRYLVSADGKTLAVELFRLHRTTITPPPPRSTDILMDTTGYDDYLKWSADVVDRYESVSTSGLNGVVKFLFQRDRASPPALLAIDLGITEDTPEADCLGRFRAWVRGSSSDVSMHVRRLEDLHRVLRAPEVRRLLWKRFTTTEASKGLAASIDERVLADGDRRYDLVTRQLVDAATPFLAKLLMDEPASVNAAFDRWSEARLATSVVDALKARLRNDRGPVANLSPSLRMDLPVAWAHAVEAAVSTSVKAFRAQVGLPAIGDATQPDAIGHDRAHAHPLSIAVHYPHRAGAKVHTAFSAAWPSYNGASWEWPQRQPSVMAHRTGFGLLIRRSGTSDWRCLNAGGAAITGSKDVALLADKDNYAVLVHPMPPTPTGSVDYDNLTLISDPDDATQHAEVSAGNAAIASLVKARVLGPGDHPPEPGRAEWVALPALAYGCNYEVAAFALRNSGTLPSNIADGTAPTMLLAGSAPPKEVVRTVEYRRHVGIGSLRVASDLRPFRRSEAPAPLLPDIPKDVLTRTSELADQSAADRRGGLLLLLDPPTADASWTRHRHEVVLLRPSIDAETLLRWFATDWYRAIDTNDTAQTKRWLELLTRIDEFDRIQRGRGSAGPDDQVDVRGDILEDPAVSHLVITLEHRDAGGTVTPRKQKAFLWPRRTALPPELASQSRLDEELGADPITLVVEASDAAEAVTLVGTTLTVTVRSGELYRLSVCPAADSSGAGRLADTTTNAETIEGVGYRLGHGQWTIDIESATAATLTEADTESVFAALATKVGADGNVRVLFSGLSDAALDARLDQYSRATVGYQIYRWDGRPVAAPPRRSPLGSDDWQRWEIQHFLERDPIEPSSQAPTRIPMVRKRAGTNAPATILHETRTGDAGGDIRDSRERYYRFQVTLMHRYRSAYRAVLPATTADKLVDVTLRAATGEPYSQWLRALRPARWQAPVPAPAVKLILPLTRSSTAGGVVGDVLVVLREQWGLVGGLAENLDVDLEDYGPDPITTIVRVDLPALRLDPPTGPIGHTFDTGSRAPLFVNTSFVVVPPIALGPWSMLKLRFRRVVEPLAANDFLLPAPPARTLSTTMTARTGQGHLSVLPGGTIKQWTLSLSWDDASLAQGIRLVGKVSGSTFSLTLTQLPNEATIEPRSCVGNLGDIATFEVPALSGLRCVATRLSASRKTSDPKLDVGARWELTFYAMPPDGQPLRCGRVGLQLDKSTAAQDGLAIESTLTSDGVAPVVHASAEPRYSDYSHSYWAQRLPDAAQIGRRKDATTDVRKFVDDGSFLRLADAASLDLRSYADLASDELDDHFHLIVVTQPVTSADGTRETERYLGTFEPQKSAAKDKTYKLIARDGHWTPNSVPVDRLIGRILLVQVTPRRRTWDTTGYVLEDEGSGDLGAAIPKGADLWELFYPSEQRESPQATQPIDAKMRLVAIGLPFGAGS